MEGLYMSHEPHPFNKLFETLIVCRLANAPYVTVVCLDRPRKRNAMNAKMWKEIGDAFRLLGTTGDGCRCVLLLGQGRAFCAGIDTSDQSFNLTGKETTDEVDVARRALAFRPQILEMQRSLTAIEECPVPVVAAIHGPCVGAGVDMTCCADVRICSPSARFGVREVRLGLAADVGTLQRLPKIVGHGSRVREICFTGEDFGPDEALRIGFVSRISETESSLGPMAVSVCQAIARNSPVAVTGTKLSLNYSRDHSVADGLEHIATHNAAALITDDIMTSFVSAASGGNSAPDFVPLCPISRL
mmetsp:Transcript_16548/g.33899  ORF Transcript_16548/g.33899 Transcript_16548/m.33899 type:complete len:302 (-) Transcript_16548:110-1015(-)